MRPPKPKNWRRAHVQVGPETAGIPSMKMFTGSVCPITSREHVRQLDGIKKVGMMIGIYPLGIRSGRTLMMRRRGAWMFLGTTFILGKK